MNSKKYLIVIKENKKANIIASICAIEKFKFPLFKKLFIPNNDTAPKVGIDSKKDIFAASILLNLNNLAAVIVIPDLLTPGIRDNI